VNDSRILRRAPRLAPGRRERSLVSKAGRALVICTIAVGAGALVFGLDGGLIVLEALGFAAAIAGLRWPALGLLGISLLCTLDPIARTFVFTGGVFRFNTLNYWLLFVIAINFASLLRWRDVQTRLILALVLVLGLGLIASPERENGVQHIVNLVSSLGVLLYLRRAGNDGESWFWIGNLAGWAGAMAGLVFYVQRDDMANVNMNTWVYVPLAGLFGCCLAMAAGRPRGTRAVMISVLAVANLLWVLLSGSRGGLLVALISGAFLLWTMRGLHLRMATVAAGALAVVLMGVYFEAEESYTVGKIQRLLDSSRSTSSRTSGHLDLAIGGWYVFLDHPLGVGTGGFASTWAEMGSAKNVPAFRYGMRMQAHSAWVKTLAENGLPGILLLIAYVVSFCLVGWRSGRERSVRLGMFVTLTLAAAFLASEFAAKGVWFLAASATVLLVAEERGRRAVQAGRGFLSPRLVPAANEIHSGQRARAVQAGTGLDRPGRLHSWGPPEGLAGPEPPA